MQLTNCTVRVSNIEVGCNCHGLISSLSLKILKRAKALQDQLESTIVHAGSEISHYNLSGGVRRGRQCSQVAHRRKVETTQDVGLLDLRHLGKLLSKRSAVAAMSPHALVLPAEHWARRGTYCPVCRGESRLGRRAASPGARQVARRLILSERVALSMRAGGLLLGNSLWGQPKVFLFNVLAAGFQSCTDSVREPAVLVLVLGAPESQKVWSVKFLQGCGLCGKCSRSLHAAALVLCCDGRGEPEAHAHGTPKTASNYCTSLRWGDVLCHSFLNVGKLRALTARAHPPAHAQVLHKMPGALVSRKPRQLRDPLRTRTAPQFHCTAHSTAPGLGTIRPSPCAMSKILPACRHCLSRCVCPTAYQELLTQAALPEGRPRLHLYDQPSCPSFRIVW
mmetsp:Transcript_2175/g.6475  ORF Transcript_2175/g.6475 Transcript_2175/m.6475 type:complete len:393 (-) Transcript_2175:37-1215(-)